MSLKEVGNFFWNDLDLILNVEKNDVIYFFDNFLSKKNGPLEKHAQFKKLSKYQVKFKTKAWITTTTQKPILVKHSFLKKYIKLNDYAKKMETHDKHKYYRNLLSHVIQKVKKYLLH